jgi:tetratricopeptide (TPR) repeat protein
MKIVRTRWQTTITKINFFSFFIFNFALFLSGCASYDAGGNVQRGRFALMRGDSKAALNYFQRASEIDSDYVTRIGPIKEGVWTYLGRAHYTNGDFKAAQKALELARTRHPDDYFAPLYLGLALAKDGDRQRGAKELQAGLNGLNEWLVYINRNSVDKAYWDPGANIQSGIQQQLARIDSKELNWNDLIAGSEWVGMELEDEGRKVNDDKRREQRDGSRSDGN